MKKLLPALFGCLLACITGTAARAAAPLHAADKCMTLEGTFKGWHGSPPYALLITKRRTYGLVSSMGQSSTHEHPEPEALILVRRAHEMIQGTFDFCLQGGEVKGSQGERIELGWIRSFTPHDPAALSARVMFVRQLKVAIIAAGADAPESAKPGHVEVVFTYKDGVVSDAHVYEDKSTADPSLYAAALADVAQAKFPLCPPEFKEILFVVMMPIYFPPDDY